MPLGRIGKKSDIAGTCLFLASEAGDYVNGGKSTELCLRDGILRLATIVLDGGSVLNTGSKL